MEKVKTPTMIWQNFNPTELPLEIIEISTEQKGELTFERFYFSGRDFPEGEKSRVFAVVCSKKSNATKPAVLLIGDPSKRICEDDLASVASNGFVAMSIDFAGKTDEGENFTVYPDCISYANFCKDERFSIRENAQETMWYEYALNAMRAISVLTEKYNAKKISLLTVFDGSIVGLIVAAMDKRLTNAAVVFGNLNVEAFGRVEINEISDEEKIDEALHRNELLDAWTMGIAPQSYVPLVKIPVFVICSANSRVTDVLSVSETSLRLSEPSRLLILPNTIDYLSDDIFGGVLKWLKGSTADFNAKLSLCNSEKGCVVGLTLQDEAEEQKEPQGQLEVWYTRNNTRSAKNWVRAELKPADNGDTNAWCAELDLYEPVSNVSVVALSNSKIPLSTPLLNVVVKQSTGLKLPKSILYGGEGNCFVALSKTQSFHGPCKKVEAKKGYLNIRGAKGTTFGTFACSDKCVDCEESDTLSFDVCCEFKQDMTVAYVADFGTNCEECYTATAKLSGDGKWQRITLNSSEFKRVSDGHSMSKATKIDLIVFDCKDAFVINNIYVV